MLFLFLASFNYPMSALNEYSQRDFCFDAQAHFFDVKFSFRALKLRFIYVTKRSSGASTVGQTNLNYFTSGSHSAAFLMTQYCHSFPVIFNFRFTSLHLTTGSGRLSALNVERLDLGQR